MMETFSRFVDRIPSWLRWPLVPLSALITAIVVWVVASILAKMLVFFDGGRGWGENFFEYLIIPAVSSYCSVVAGTVTAPKFRKIIALLLSAIWVFTAGATTFVSIVSSMWPNLILIASVCVGSWIAANSNDYDSERHLMPESNETA